MSTSFKITSLGRRQWVVGLQWAHLDERNPGKDAKRYIRQKSVESKYTGFCVRQAGKRQADPKQLGLCDLQEFKKGGKSLPSLAAAVADAKRGTWVGCFSLPEGVWVVYVDEDFILPRGDRLFESEEGARDYLEQIIHEHGDTTPQVVAPAKEDALTELTVLLKETRRLTMVRPIHKHYPIKKLLVASVVVGLLIAFFSAYKIYEARRLEELRAEQEAAFLAAQKELAARKAAQKKAPSPPPPPPPPVDRAALTAQYFPPKWDEASSALSFAESCRGAMLDLPYSISGWVYLSGVCAPPKLVIEWTREAGGVFREMPPGSDINLQKPNVAQSVYNIPFTKNNKRVPGRSLYSQNEVAKAMLDLNLLVPGAYIQISWIRAEVKNVAVNGKDERLNAPYKRCTWTITKLQSFPWIEIFEYLDSIPGTVVQSVSYSSGTGTWTIKGEIYVVS